MTSPDSSILAKDIKPTLGDRDAAHVLSRTGSLGMTVITILAAWLVAGVCLMVVPRMVATFEDFDAELPTLTRVILAIPSLGYVAGAMLVTGLLIAMHLIVRDPRVRLTVALATAVIVGGVVVGLIFALFVPFVRLIESMQ